MLTVNDIRNVRFTTSMGKYKAAEVDEFIDRCAETISALTAAKIELEKKLEVLADKLVEYRNDEDNIRTALLSAQKLGDTVVREARHKAGLILDDANIKAEKIQENAKRNIKEEEMEMERIRREITNFKARMLSIYREHLSLIDVLPEVKDDNADSAGDTGQEDQSVQPEEAEAAGYEETGQETDPVFEPVEEQPQMSLPDAAAATPDVVLDIPELQDEEENGGSLYGLQMPVNREEKPVSRFGDLKFGDGYDISKDGEQENTGFFRRRK